MLLITGWESASSIELSQYILPAPIFIKSDAKAGNKHSIKWNDSFGNYTLRCVMRKQTLRCLSLSYQKKDGHGHAHPSFGMTPIFSEYDLWSQKTQIWVYLYQKKDGRGHAHPSFGMTTTKTLRSVFSWHTSLGKVWRALLWKQLVSTMRYRFALSKSILHLSELWVMRQIVLSYAKGVGAPANLSTKGLNMA